MNIVWTSPKRHQSMKYLHCLGDTTVLFGIFSCLFPPTHLLIKEVKNTSPQKEEQGIFLIISDNSFFKKRFIFLSELIFHLLSISLTALSNWRGLGNQPTADTGFSWENLYSNETSDLKLNICCKAYEVAIVLLLQCSSIPYHHKSTAEACT